MRISEPGAPWVGVPADRPCRPACPTGADDHLHVSWGCLKRTAGADSLAGGVVGTFCWPLVPKFGCGLSVATAGVNRLDLAGVHGEPEEFLNSRDAVVWQKERERGTLRRIRFLDTTSKVICSEHLHQPRP